MRGVWMMLRALQEPSSNGKTRAQVGAITAAVEARGGGSGRCGDGEKVRTGIVFVAMAQRLCVVVVVFFLFPFRRERSDRHLD